MKPAAAPMVHAPDCPAGHWLALAHAADRDMCGGKAVALARMLCAGLPVPAGGVLTVQALHDFMAGTGLDARIAALEACWRDGTHTAQALEQSMLDLFVRTPRTSALAALLRQAREDFGEAGAVAVRSSAVGEDGAHASYAGMMDSVLDVDPASGIEAAVKRVWASRWSARALAYAHARGESPGSVAVIVQRQVDARCAGVLFTRSPDCGYENRMTCEYCAGLADGLVAGAITPKRLRIDRARLTGEHEDGAEDATTPDVAEIAALARAGLAAEQLFGAAQDIEWVLDRTGKLWLVQSRPITARMVPGAERRRVLWSNANVNENFPAPITPLLYSVIAPGYSAYFENLGRAFGLARSRRQHIAGDLRAIVGVHAGRLYYNLSAIHAVLREAPCGERLVAWFDDFTGAGDPRPDAPTARKRFARGLRELGELAWMGLKTAWQYAFIRRRLRGFERTIDAFAARAAPQRLRTLDTLALRDLLRGFMQIRLERWTDAALCDAAAMVCYGALKSAVANALPANAAGSVHNDLLKGLSGLESAEPVNALWALAQAVRADAALAALFDSASSQEIEAALSGNPRYARFERMFRDYLERWGFRCSGELMLTRPSFQEEPAKLLEIVRSFAREDDAAPQARLARQRAERTATTRRVLGEAARRRYLRFLPWPSHATPLPLLIGATHAAIAWRERARLKQALLYSRLRRIALEIGERLAVTGTLRSREDVFFLTVPELDELLSGHAMFPGESARLVRIRRKAHARFSAQAPADTIAAREGDYPAVVAPRTAAAPASDRLCGISVCGGVSTGRARVLTDVSQTRELRAGDILVTRQTDPGWAPAFVHIGALVLERGGMLSHGAILAREYGIPTIVGIAGATERIADRATVRVDADHGDVHVLA
jgi:rifampicin phosphotransferase